MKLSYKKMPHSGVEGKSVQPHRTTDPFFIREYMEYKTAHEREKVLIILFYFYFGGKL